MIVFFLCALILQNTAVVLFCAGGAGPQLLLAAAVLSVFFAEEEKWAVAAAVCAGALQDLCFSIYAGPGAAASFAAAVTASAAKRLFAWERPRFFFLFSALSAVVYNFTLWGGEKLLGAPFRFAFLIRVLPLYMVYSLAVMGSVYFLFIKNKESGYPT